MDEKTASRALVLAAARRLGLSLTDDESVLLRSVLEPLTGSSIHTQGPEAIEGVEIPAGRAHEIRSWHNNDRRCVHGMLQLVLHARKDGIVEARQREIGLVYALVFHVVFPTGKNAA